MSNTKAYLVVEGSSYGREGASWLTPGGWFFMFEDGDVRLRAGYVSYHSTIGRCRKVLSDRIAALRPLSGQLPCPELVEYLDDLLLWLSDFLPEKGVLADFGELDEMFFNLSAEDGPFEDDQWRSGAGSDYLLPEGTSESFHAYTAFNVSQWLKVVESGRWDRAEDGLRYVGIADDVWGDTDEGRGIVIGFEVEAPIEYRSDADAALPDSRHLSPEEFLREGGG